MLKGKTCIEISRMAKKKATAKALECKAKERAAQVKICQNGYGYVYITLHSIEMHPKQIIAIWFALSLQTLMLL